ncbi:hypothetical protein GCM10020331_080470 [Ectobacillus funiculus]
MIFFCKYGEREKWQKNPAFKDPRVLLAPEARAQIPAPILDKITAALSSSITITFMWALIPTALAFIVAMMMSKERLQSSIEYQQARGEQKAGHAHQ